MYSIQDIEKARKQAVDLGLVGADLFVSLPVEVVQRCCNGIGAAWMPEASRRLLNKRFPILQTAAMIHDVRYQFGAGTDEDFHLANDELFRNGCLLAKAQFAWWSPVRYFVMYDAHRIAKICDMFGRRAYYDAQERTDDRELANCAGDDNRGSHDGDPRLDSDQPGGDPKGSCSKGG